MDKLKDEIIDDQNKISDLQLKEELEKARSS